MVVTPGRVTGEQLVVIQLPLEQKWFKGLNKLVMKCYIKSKSRTRGYRKRMYAVSREVGEFEISE